MAANGFRTMSSLNCSKKLEEHTIKLRDALMEDVKAHRKFKDELSALSSSEGFDFELGLKSERRSYKGNGKDQLRRLIDRVIPSLEEITIRDELAEKFFKNIISKMYQERKEEMPVAEKSFDKTISLVKKAFKTGTKIAAKRVTEEVVEASANLVLKKTVKSFAKEGTQVLLEKVNEEAVEASCKMAVQTVVGSGSEASVLGNTVVDEVGVKESGQVIVEGTNKGVEECSSSGSMGDIALGTLSALKNGFQFYKVYKKESNAEIVIKIVDDVSQLPPEQIDFLNQ
jgi:hypothetical protein